MNLRRLMCVLWPSFLVAAATSAAVFALVDPRDILFLDYLRASRELVYTIGFFLFWGMAALSSAISLLLEPRGDQDGDFDEAA
jgi:hypothetical protein